MKGGEGMEFMKGGKGMEF